MGAYSMPIVIELKNVSSNAIRLFIVYYRV